MLKKVLRCTLYLSGGQTMTVSEKDGEAVITRAEGEEELASGNSETKQADIRVLRSLDIVFNGIESEPFDASDADKPHISVLFEDDAEECVICDSGLLKQLAVYLDAYSDGTAEPFSLSFHSFDGGGPEYSFENEKTGIFTWYAERVYNSTDHEQLCGAGYNVYFHVYPLKAGEATAVISGDSPICREPKRRLFVTVAQDLSTEYHIEEIG